MAESSPAPESVDDSWIFESLGCSSISNGSQALDVLKSSENEAEICGMKKETIKQQSDEVITPSERSQFVKNMYSLIVTARTQIKRLKEENRLLENRLDANFLTRCPNCSRRFDVRKNMIKPNYIKVLKARNTLELTFDNMDRLKEWIQLNSLENNRDGLPVLLESTGHPTLSSTDSLLAGGKKGKLS